MKKAIVSCLGLLMVAFALGGAPSAEAEAPTDAKMRAALYQAEARREFSDHRWVVVHDEPGKLTLAHGAWPGGAQFAQVAVYGPMSPSRVTPHAVLHLTIVFRPVSAIQTQCSARLVGYYNSAVRDTDKPKLTGPYPANNEENTKEVQSLIAKAEKRLTAQHPEYRAP